MVDVNELSRLWEEAHKESQKNKQIISDYIQAMTDKKLRVRSTCYYYSQSNEVSVNVEFVDETTGNSDFGSDFDIYYRTYHRDETPELQMGCGTIGSHTRKEAPFQIDRMRLMLKLWDHEEEVVNLFKSLSCEANQAAEKLQRQKDNEEAEVERLAREKKEQEVKANIQVGYTFSDECKGGGSRRKYFDYTITKITPKRVYFAYSENFECSYQVWKDNVCLGEQAVLRHIKRTGYVEYNKLFNRFMELDNKSIRPLAETMRGVSWDTLTEDKLEFKSF